MLPRAFRVVGKEWETEDTATIQLVDVSGGAIDFRPGQCMMLYLFGLGEVPISIAGNPAEHQTLVHTIRSVGKVTEGINALEPGDEIGVRGPFGTSWPVDKAIGKDLLIIAGGIGLAPLRPAVLEAMDRRSELGSLSLLYGARTPKDLLYKADLLGWETNPDMQVEISVDRARLDWRGDVGLVTTLLPRIDFDPKDTEAFICGPEVMMRVVARDLRDRGIPSDRIAISMERNMKCAIGFCGHCQYGSDFLCKTGPIGTLTKFAGRLTLDEL
jgi:NAD(P)H-flavin reductase